MSTKPGLATAEKMRKLVEVSVKRSLGKRANSRKVDALLDVAATFEYLVIYWTDPSVHIERFFGEKYKSMARIPRTMRWSLELAARHDTCPLVFFGLWRELGEALRELVCSNYDSVPRSLRWLLETCVFWADMQLDEDCAQDLFEYYHSQKSKLTRSEFARMSIEIRRVSEARLEERLIFKEKFGSPSVKQIIQDLLVLKNRSRSTYKYKVALKREMMDCYSEFSQYAHFTPSTVKEIRLEPGSLHTDFAFFQDYHYDKGRFDIGAKSIYRTLDLVMTIMILVESAFYSYEGPIEFFSSLKDAGREFASKIASVRQDLPFTSRVVEALVSK